MRGDRPGAAGGLTRRRFLHAASVAAASATPLWAAAAEPAPAAGDRLAFTAEGQQFQFDTGTLRGTLRPQGKSLGLTPVVESASGQAIAKPYGLFSHYRLLDDRARYGHAAWDWASQAQRRPDGAVLVRWSADDAHPFDMQAEYRWTAPGALDLATRVTPRRALVGFEVFLASYFEGFAASLVYVKDTAASHGKPGFRAATKTAGAWQMFARDAAAEKLIGDGRWRRPPNPVDWQIGPRLAAPLALRRDAQTGLTAVLMAPVADCFAVATPFGEDGHRSLYLSLFGRDLPAGEAATARARLVVGRAISDDRAAALYAAYAKEGPH